jgi:gamma-glutamylcyclotransferase (GGCT)/AIG2-like uncharacterized protein YtfP
MKANALPRLPFFVYGTLRPGFGFQNYRDTLRDTTTDGGIAMVPNAALWHLTGFPGVYLPQNGVAAASALSDQFDFTGTVTGSLLYVAGKGDDAYRAALARADRLECYLGKGHPDNMYQRVEVDAVTETGQVITAWLYEALIDPAGSPTAKPVPLGDWPTFVEAQQVAVAGEEWKTGIA